MMMSAEPYLRSCHIRNYRGLRDLRCETIRRVNVVGGLNGSGKTTLLEALFLVFDRLSPTAFVRPYLTRNIPITLDSAIGFSYTDQNRTMPISIEVDLRDGPVKAEITFEQQPIAPQHFLEKLPVLLAPPQEAANNMGITFRVSGGDKTQLVAHFSDVPPAGMQTFNEISEPMKLPPCSFVNKERANIPSELSAHFTTVVQERRKSRIVHLAKTILPEIKDIQLLQIGGQPQVCGEIEEEVFVPLNFLGDGVLMIVAIGLYVMNSKNGVVMLDEFDTAIHYSRLRIVWKELLLLSREVNCQIFAATHSMECIKAAVAGAQDAGIPDDLQYMRLDKRGKKNICTTYTHNDLDTAFREEWEVR